MFQIIVLDHRVNAASQKTATPFFPHCQLPEDTISPLGFSIPELCQVVFPSSEVLPPSPQLLYHNMCPLFAGVTLLPAYVIW